MIGKIIIGNSFGPCITYVLGETKIEKEKFAETGIEKATVLKYNYCYGDKKELIQQFNDVKNLNQKMNRAVAHIILSFSHDDKLSHNQMREVCGKLAIKMKFEKNQYFSVRHNDTGNHIHLIVNRVGFDAITLSDSNNYKNLCDFCREIEIEYGLEKVLSPRRFLPIEQRNIPRENVRLDRIKDNVIKAVLKSNNYDELRYVLMAAKIDLHLARGITFIDEQKVRVKGSKIGLSKNYIDDYFLNKHQSKLNNTEPKELLLNKLIKSDDFKTDQNTINLSEIHDLNAQKPVLIIDNLKKVVDEVLRFSSNIDELKYELLIKGISIEIGRGLTFICENKVRIKGSDIGYSLQTLERHFEKTVRKITSTKLEDNSMINLANQPDEVIFQNSKIKGEEVNIRVDEIHRLSNTVMLELTNQIAFRVGINKNQIQSIKISEDNVNFLKVLITNPPNTISRIDVIVKEVFEDIVLKYNLRTINILNNNDLSKLDDNYENIEIIRLKEIIVEAMNESEDWFDLKNELRIKGISYNKKVDKIVFIKNNIKILGEKIDMDVDKIDQFFEEKNNEKINKPYKNKI